MRVSPPARATLEPSPHSVPENHVADACNSKQQWHGDTAPPQLAPGPLGYPEAQQPHPWQISHHQLPWVGRHRHHRQKCYCGLRVRKDPKTPKSQRSASHRHQKLLRGPLAGTQDGTMGHGPSWVSSLTRWGGVGGRMPLREGHRTERDDPECGSVTFEELLDP